MSYPEIKQIKRNPTLEGQVCLRQNVVYSTQTGENLKMTLFLPWNLEHPQIPKEPKPLIVFVQGSAWTTPDLDFEIPQLAQFAREGYIVTTVGHRDSQKGHPFPAYLQDVKCAIRYLRKHAGEYGIDTERVAIWGTSSGGNTALLVGTTGDDPRYETKEHAGYSDSVCAVVSCFGPTDLIGMMEDAQKVGNTAEFEFVASCLYGPDKSLWEERAKEMSPVSHVEPGRKYPPFLLLHGTADTMVSYDQMLRMYHKLCDCQADVEAYRIDGAEHELDFWSDEVYNVIAEFLRKKLDIAC